MLAYQILSDKSKRRYYDRSDTSATNKEPYSSDDEPLFQNSAPFPDLDGFSGSEHSFFKSQYEDYEDYQLHDDNHRRGWKRKQFFSLDDLLNDDLFEDKLFNEDESFGKINYNYNYR